MTGRRGKHGQRVRIAVFLATGLLALLTAVFLIGDKSGLFEAKATLHAEFSDVQGLVVGAPVRLAGLDIGMVTEIEFSPTTDRVQARVSMSIRERYLARIREDSRAKIDSKGLLGDKLVEISVGTPALPALSDGATVKSAPAASLAELANSLDDAVASITRAADTADRAMTSMVNERTRTDVERLLSSLASIAEAIDRGDGIVHRLLHDEAFSERVASLAEGADRTLQNSARASERVDKILAAVERGPGGAHALLFGEDLSQALAELRGASTTLHAVTQEVRHGKGLLHELVYGEEQAAMLANTASATARLDRLLSAVEDGQGTVGGLMVDPTVYEDMKQILGNVERNVLLKALVRFAIKEGDIERPADVPEAKPAR